MNTKVIKVNIVLAIVALALLVLSATFSLPITVGATTSTTYNYVFSAVEEVATWNNELYIRTGGKVVKMGDKLEEVDECDCHFVVNGGEVVKARHGGMMFLGSRAGEVTPKTIYFHNQSGETVFLQTKDEFVCATASGNTLYVIEKTSYLSLVKYDIASMARTVLAKHIPADGEITAMTVCDDVYYATPYSLFSLGNSDGENIGGITSLATKDGEIYYTTRSGKLCTRKGEVVLRPAERISVASRNTLVAYADYGNNKVTVIGADTTEIAVSKPTSVAINYDGNVYVSSVDKIYIYSNGELSVVKTDAEGNYYAQVALSDSPISDELYTLTEEGELTAPNGQTKTGVQKFALKRKAVYYMTEDGCVYKCNADLSSDEKLLDGGDFSGLDVDEAGNVYRSGNEGIFKGTEKISDKGCEELCVSSAHVGNLNFGDVIVASSLALGSEIIAKIDAKTNMLDDVQAYKEYIDTTDNDSPNGSATYDLDIRKVLRSGCISDVPVLLPSNDSDTVSADTFVTVLDVIDGFAYVIAEDPKTGKSIKGFIDERLLTPLEENELYDDTSVKIVAMSNVYKYPSVLAPILGSADVNDIYDIVDFVDGYTDAYGRTWCRINYNGKDGYCLRSVLAVGSNLEGEYKQIFTNGIIKNPDGAITYYDDNFNAVLGSIPVGTKVRVEQDYTKSKDFMKVTFYISNDLKRIMTCYVKTEDVKMTEATWYQLVWFIIAVIVAVAIIVIIIMRYRRNRVLRNL